MQEEQVNAASALSFFGASLPLKLPAKLPPSGIPAAPSEPQEKNEMSAHSFPPLSQLYTPGSYYPPTTSAEEGPSPNLTESGSRSPYHSSRENQRKESVGTKQSPANPKKDSSNVPAIPYDSSRSSSSSSSLSSPPQHRSTAVRKRSPMRLASLPHPSRPKSKSAASAPRTPSKHVDASFPAADRSLSGTVELNSAFFYTPLSPSTVTEVDTSSRSSLLNERKDHSGASSDERSKEKSEEADSFFDSEARQTEPEAVPPLRLPSSSQPRRPSSKSSKKLTPRPARPSVGTTHFTIQHCTPPPPDFRSGTPFLSRPPGTGARGASQNSGVASPTPRVSGRVRARNALSHSYSAPRPSNSRAGLRPSKNSERASQITVTNTRNNRQTPLQMAEGSAAEDFYRQGSEMSRFPFNGDSDGFYSCCGTSVSGISPRSQSESGMEEPEARRIEEESGGMWNIRRALLHTFGLRRSAVPEAKEKNKTKKKPTQGSRKGARSRPLLSASPAASGVASPSPLPPDLSPISSAAFYSCMGPEPSSVPSERVEPSLAMTNLAIGSHQPSRSDYQSTRGGTPSLLNMSIPLSDLLYSAQSSTCASSLSSASSSHPPLASVDDGVEPQALPLLLESLSSSLLIPIEAEGEDEEGEEAVGKSRFRAPPSPTVAHRPRGWKALPSRSGGSAHDAAASSAAAPHALDDSDESNTDLAEIVEMVEV